MRQISKRNKYYDSDGNSYSQSQLNRKISEAKAMKVDQMRLDYGFVFCEEENCGKNENAGEPLDCSHEISVQQAKNERCIELCWDWQNNIKIRCRTCHKKKDKLNLQWTK